MQLMVRYICLKCYNRWSSRSGRPRVLRCTNLKCHSRQICEFSEFENVVLTVKSFIDTAGRPLQGATVFEALFSVRQLRLKRGLSLPDSLDFFNWVYHIASNFDPEQENLEDVLDRLESVNS